MTSLRAVAGLLAPIALAACAAAPPMPAVEAPAVAVVARSAPVSVPVPAPAPLVEWPPLEPAVYGEVDRFASAALLAEPLYAQAPAETGAGAPGRPGTPQVAAVPPPEPAPPPVPIVVQQEPTPEEREFTALLADLQRYTTLPVDDLRRELGTQTQALNRSRSDATRVRVAVLHTLARQGAQDDQRALQLLDAVAKSGAGYTGLKQLAAVLSVQVAERVRAVREEQARSEAAIQKLEALRAMERSLLRDRLRGGGGGGGAGSGGN